MALATNYELKLGAATREAFGRALVEVARENANVVGCDADLSKSTMMTYFAKEFPARFFECGIAEANMVALGAGLAMTGKIPFVSSFSCFVMNKGFEQLRTTAAYPGVNLKVVGTHSGISIGEDGPSQMSIEDLALACALPGFTVISPADEVATRAAVLWAAAHFGPVFLRTGRAKVPLIYPPGANIEIGRPYELLPGRDVTLVAHGMMVAECIRAAAARETGVMVVAEEHLVDSGLGVRVAQALARHAPAPIEFIGLETYAESGTPAGVPAKYGLTSANIVAAARRAMARKAG